MPELPDPRCIHAIPATKDASLWAAFRQQLVLDWQAIRTAITAATRRPEPLTQTIIDVDTISSGDKALILTAAGATLMASTPTIANGEDGVTLLLINLGPGTITFQDDATLPGSGLLLRSGTVAIPANQSISFYWADAIGFWVQVAP